MEHVGFDLQLSFVVNQDAVRTVVRFREPLQSKVFCFFAGVLQFSISGKKGGSRVSGEHAPPEAPPPTANPAHVFLPPPVRVM